MFKYLIISFLFVAALAVQTQAQDIDWFTGQWHPVVTFPDIFDQPMCHNHVVTKSSAKCVCGEKTDVPVLIFDNLVQNHTETHVVLFTEDAGKIAQIIASTCTCDGVEKTPIAMQKFNDNTFATFEFSERITDHGQFETNLCIVYVKKALKLKQLHDFISSVDHFKLRKSSIVCEPEWFDKDDSS